MPNHDAAAVAQRIGKSEAWVRRNWHQLPHHRFGQTRVFTDEDIELILQRAAVRPEQDVDDGQLRPVARRRRIA